MPTCGFDLGPTNRVFDSAQFSETVNQIVGDGVAPLRNRLKLTVNSGFSVTVSTGYALAAGRWVRLDQPLRLTLPPSGYANNRYDAIAVQVNFAERKAEIVALSAIDPDEPIQNESVYVKYLYVIHIRRGASSLNDSDVTDVRHIFPPLSSLSVKTIAAYEYVVTGLDTEIARVKKLASDGGAALLSRSEAILAQADADVAALQNAVRGARGVAIGDLSTGISKPSPTYEWLLCNGGEITEAYPELRELLGDSLPNIIPNDGRFKTWIYAGAPVTSADDYFSVTDEGNLELLYPEDATPGFQIEDGNLIYIGDEKRTFFINQLDGHLYEILS